MCMHVIAVRVNACLQTFPQGTFFTPLLVCSFIGDSTAESALLLLGNGVNVNGSTQVYNVKIASICATCIHRPSQYEMLIGNYIIVLALDARRHTYSVHVQAGVHAWLSYEPLERCTTCLSISSSFHCVMYKHTCTCRLVVSHWWQPVQWVLSR